ncbi:MAG TPA: DUF1320 family protein [Kiritimatiellia bacterium]|nr:DUF1320 family protein [Kiritimatiellia bacterium]HMO99793.1 DUF1320 family protein [Kiritimatiellia bacterium]HMP97228.1 DUF1320 family protein [Kiritimatiellia bacterium]
MSYLQDEITSRLPKHILLKALDDNGDGVEDDGLWAAVAEAASGAVDAYLEGRYALPLSRVPALVREAAEVFGCEMIYDRAGQVKENPWRDRANGMRATLQKVSEGAMSLGDDLEPAGGPGGLVSEPAKTHRTNGGLMV